MIWYQNFDGGEFWSLNFETLHISLYVRWRYGAIETKKFYMIDFTTTFYIW